MRVAIITPERAKALGIPYVSPSAVAAWLECPRKWAYRYIAKIYEPSPPSALLGTDAHKQLELYLTEGKPLDFTRSSGEILQSGLHFFPEPKTPGMQGEGEFYLLSERTGSIYMGKKDVELPPGVPQPQLGFDGSAPIIEDLKTTSSIDNYAKSEDDLRFDPQAGMYAIDAMVRYDLPFADLGWVYCQTRGPKKSHPVAFRMHKNEAERLFDAVESIADEMHATRVSIDAESIHKLPPNPSACRAYGGCPHEHRCNLSPSQKARARMSGNSLIASLRNRVQGETAPAPAAPAPPTSVMGCSDKDVPAPTEIPAAFLAPTPEVKVQSDPINPPESQLPQAPLPEKASAEDDKPKKERKPRAKKVGAEVKEATVDGPFDVSFTQTIESPVAAPALVASNGAEKASASGACAIPYTLYVDCLPVGREVAEADDLLEEANAIVVERQKTTPEPVEHYSFLSFGKGKGAIALALEEVVDNHAELVDVYCASTSDALSTLTKRAGRIVRGVR